MNETKTNIIQWNSQPGYWRTVEEKPSRRALRLPAHGCESRWHHPPDREDDSVRLEMSKGTQIIPGSVFVVLQFRGDSTSEVQGG